AGDPAVPPAAGRRRVDEHLLATGKRPDVPSQQRWSATRVCDGDGSGAPNEQLHVRLRQRGHTNGPPRGEPDAIHVARILEAVEPGGQSGAPPRLRGERAKAREERSAGLDEVDVVVWLERVAERGGIHERGRNVEQPVAARVVT